MKISLATHGGWGGRFAQALTLDTTSLPPEAALQGAHLAAAAEAAPDGGTAAAAAAAAPARAPEAQSYTITIDHGDRSLTLKTSDTGADPAVHALMDWIKTHA